MGGFDKTFLSLPRLLHILALTYLVVADPGACQPGPGCPDHPLAVLGKHSLPVFVAGTLLCDGRAGGEGRLRAQRRLRSPALLIAGGIAVAVRACLLAELLPEIGWRRQEAGPQRPAMRSGMPRGRNQAAATADPSL